MWIGRRGPRRGGRTRRHSVAVSRDEHLEQLTGRSFDWHQLDEARQVEIRRDLEAAGPMPGVVPLLGALRDRGLPLAVVSSSSHSWVDGWLEHHALTQHFERTVCRGSRPPRSPGRSIPVGAPKPNCLAQAKSGSAPMPRAAAKK